MSNDSSEFLYNGTFPRSVDKKRRVQLPSGWLESGKPEERLALVPWARGPHEAAYIAVFPPQVMGEVAAKLKGMLYSDPKAQALRRLIGGGSENVTPDSEARILLPEKMAELAGIEPGKMAVFVGVFDRFEIWNEDRWNEAKITDAVYRPEALGLI